MRRRFWGVAWRLAVVPSGVQTAGATPGGRQAMRMRFWGVAWMLAMVASAVQTGGQNPGATQAQPMGATSAHDMPAGQQAGIDQPAMHHEMAQAKASMLPLKLTFGDRMAEWTAEKLAALPHATLTVYNEHMKVNQTYSGVPLIE